MIVGDIVEHVNPRGLHCGSLLYQSAVVAHVDPLALVSHGGEMVWHKKDDEVDKLTVVGTASVEVMCKVLNRITGDLHTERDVLSKFETAFRGSCEECADLEESNIVLREISNDLKDAMVMDHLTAQADLVKLRAAVRAWDDITEGLPIGNASEEKVDAYLDVVHTMVRFAREEL